MTNWIVWLGHHLDMWQVLVAVGTSLLNSSEQTAVWNCKQDTSQQCMKYSTFESSPRSTPFIVCKVFSIIYCRYFDEEGNTTRTTTFDTECQHHLADRPGSFELLGDRVTKLGTNMWVVITITIRIIANVIMMIVRPL